MPWPTPAASVILTIEASWKPSAANTCSAASSSRRRVAVPRDVRFVERLPRNALDKVAKAELLELVR